MEPWHKFAFVQLGIWEATLLVNGLSEVANPLSPNFKEEAPPWSSPYSSILNSGSLPEIYIYQ
jgi:hypothetical protein